MSTLVLQWLPRQSSGHWLRNPLNKNEHPCFAVVASPIVGPLAAQSCLHRLARGPKTRCAFLTVYQTKMARPWKVDQKQGGSLLLGVCRSAFYRYRISYDSKVAFVASRRKRSGGKESLSGPIRPFFATDILKNGCSFVLFAVHRLYIFSGDPSQSDVYMKPIQSARCGISI
jgi:hypothetical protein